MTVSMAQEATVAGLELMILVTSWARLRVGIDDGRLERGDWKLLVLVLVVVPVDMMVSQARLMAIFLPHCSVLIIIAIELICRRCVGA